MPTPVAPWVPIQAIRRRTSHADWARPWTSSTRSRPGNPEAAGRATPVPSDLRGPCMGSTGMATLRPRSRCRCSARRIRVSMRGRPPISAPCTQTTHGRGPSWWRSTSVRIRRLAGWPSQRARPVSFGCGCQSLSKRTVSKRVRPTHLRPSATSVGADGSSWYERGSADQPAFANWAMARSASRPMRSSSPIGIGRLTAWKPPRTSSSRTTCAPMAGEREGFGTPTAVKRGIRRRAAIGVEKTSDRCTARPATPAHARVDSTGTTLTTCGPGPRRAARPGRAGCPRAATSGRRPAHGRP